jgi:hypothetical protein
LQFRLVDLGDLVGQEVEFPRKSLGIFCEAFCSTVRSIQARRRAGVFRTQSISAGEESRTSIC